MPTRRVHTLHRERFPFGLWYNKTQIFFIFGFVRAGETRNVMHRSHKAIKGKRNYIFFFHEGSSYYTAAKLLNTANTRGSRSCGMSRSAAPVVIKQDDQKKNKQKKKKQQEEKCTYRRRPKKKKKLGTRHSTCCALSLSLFACQMTPQIPPPRI
jgi:hypothetical protein